MPPFDVLTEVALRPIASSGKEFGFFCCGLTA
jgi:hypothetical protein